jgi:putative inorganic carbon (HCO3(-)) transporter
MSTPPPSALRIGASRRQSFAYGGLLVFTVLLYLRPNEWFPLLGTFPVVKIIAIVSLIALFMVQISEGRPLSVMPREFKLLLGLTGLMVLSIPFGMDAGDSLGAFTDVYLKVLLIFVLMINVVNSFKRLRRLLEVTVLCGTALAIGTLVQYAQGLNMSDGFRAQGIVGGAFGNPNDLALALNIMLPIAIGLALSRPAPATKAFYWACTGLLGLTVLVSYSRAGFLTVVLIGVLLMFRLGRKYPAFLGLGVAALLVVVLVAPPSFWARVFTVFDSSGDAQAAQSSELRWSLLQRSLEVAGFNPRRWLFGVGMNNFHIVSVHELAQHNAYLQMFNEVGLPAIIIYVMFLFGLIRTMGRIAKAYERDRAHRHVWLMAISIQISLIAYAVGSFFAPVAYLWYLYYVAGFAVCLKLLVLASRRNRQQPAPQEASRGVWYLRRA